MGNSSEGSVGALFIAGVIPGFLLGLTFIVYCTVTAIRDPSIAPMADSVHDYHSEGKSRAEFTSGMGIVALIVLVLGGIWSGIFTPTEAAGFGVLGSIILGYTKGMRGKEFMEAIYNAGRSTAPIMFLLIASITATAIELFSTPKYNDNILIPIATSFILTLGGVH